MRYSLLSRFHGTLLGAALGEILGVYCQTRLQTKQPLTGLEQGYWTIAPLNANIPSGWGKIAVDYAHALSQGAANLIDPDLDRPVSSAGVAIATLPIALFFHEDVAQLRYHLGRVTAGWFDDPELQGGVLAVSYAIALALQEQLHPAHLIPQLVAELNLAHHSPILTQQLRQVQMGIDQRVGLAGVMAMLSDHETAADLVPFSLAFYCFLNTPEDYSLGLRRSLLPGLPLATRLTHQLAVAGALTGSLSGAYNSFAAIPVEWRQRGRAVADTPLAGLWNLSSIDKIEQLASQLLVAWSGIYHPASRVQFHQLPLVTAAPYVIRPR